MNLVAATLTGVAASPGTVLAPAVSWEPGGVAVEPAVDVDDASARVVADLQVRATAATTAEGTAVLEALAMFAADPELLALAKTHVAGGEAPEAAVRTAAAAYADPLRGLGGSLAERAPDVEDVGARLGDALAGRAPAELPRPGHPYVLAARDLAPADTALLDPAVVVGIVTEQGGPTSHTTILARSLGIPAVVACPGARSAVDGREVLLDGTRGEVHVNPPAELVAQVRGREDAAAARRKLSQGPGATADGVAVKLLANVGTVDEAVAAAAADVEGIGLFRTEFLFLGRAEEPDVEEQVDTYAAVLAAFGDRRVVFRTLDAGSDKPVPFLGLADEDNPALGVRGLRTAAVRPDVLTRQLQALAAAAVRTGTDPWVMAPMVSTSAEAASFAAQAREAGLHHVGVMVEVPSAALRAGQVLRSVDFASIGTNDLAQYALAADRQLGDVAELLDPWQPALLDLVALTCAGADAHGIPTGVCGEAAADAHLAAVLVGLGVRSLSMAPRAVAAVRSTLAGVELSLCRRAAEAALAAEDAIGARAAVAALLGEPG
jgi:phosphotransferase system enzyme I (PtsI)